MFHNSLITSAIFTILFYSFFLVLVCVDCIMLCCELFDVLIMETDEINF